MSQTSELRVESLDIFPVRLRFRRPFAHHKRARREARPAIVQLRLSDGSVGYGESLPRPYVTGETEESVRLRLDTVLRAAVMDRGFSSLEDVRDWVESPKIKQAREGAPAAFCGLELALLDAVGRSTDRPVSDLLGSTLAEELVYDGAVIGFLPLSALSLYVGRLRDLGKRVVKVKVGRPEDTARIERVRRIMGDDVELVLDANGAWTAREAIANIRGLEHFGLAAVEQPVPGADVEGLARVSNEVGVPIVADESICTMADAQQLLEFDACSGWNLRVGKCGGLLGTLELAKMADQHGVQCRMGVLVGESGLLGAAGRLLAAAVPSFEHLEFDESGNRLDDILREPLAPVVNNRVALEVGGPGLGVTVDEAKLRDLALDAAPDPPSAGDSSSSR